MNFIFRIIDCFIVLLLTIVAIVSIPFIYSKLSNRPVYTDPNFKTYLDLFEKDAKKHNVNLDLYKTITIFGIVSEESVAAYCVPNTKTIVVSKKTWNELDESSRKALLYHEWGHCILRRDHAEQINYFSMCPESLMYPYIDPMKTCYKKYEDWYNEELFLNPLNFDKFSRRKK